MKRCFRIQYADQDDKVSTVGGLEGIEVSSMRTAEQPKWFKIEESIHRNDIKE